MTEMADFIEYNNERAAQEAQYTHTSLAGAVNTALENTTDPDPDLEGLIRTLQSFDSMVENVWASPINRSENE